MSKIAMLAAIGCYTSGEPLFDGARGSGIVLAGFDSSDGRLLPRSLVPLPNPSYLDTDGEGTVFAVSERFDEAGGIYAFKREGDVLAPLWRASSNGFATCHVACLAAGSIVAVANYLDGSIAIFDARSGEVTSRFFYQGSGPLASRQSSSHPHQIVCSPGGCWLLVPDLGADVVHLHPIMGCFVGESSHSLSLPPGTGPRHLVFHSCGRNLSVMGELDGVVHTGDWDEEAGGGNWIRRVPTCPGIPCGMASGSAIRCHNGLLYAANRADHSIAVIRANPETTPALIDRVPCGGLAPRDIVISPCHRWLLAACQDSHKITAIPLDPETGLPTGPAVLSLETGSPASILFL